MIMCVLLCYPYSVIVQFNLIMQIKQTIFFDRQLCHKIVEF